MRRGEVWWALIPPPVGRRPVVLVSRNEAYASRNMFTVAPVTTHVRGIPVEVPLGREDGLPRSCAINVDSIMTVHRSNLVERITFLKGPKRKALDDAIRFALGLDEPA